MSTRALLPRINVGRLYERGASSADLQQIADLLTMANPSEDWQPENIHAFGIKNDGRREIRLLVEKELVHAVAMVHYREGVARIRRLVVRTESRTQGVGSRLLCSIVNDSSRPRLSFSMRLREHNVLGQLFLSRRKFADGHKFVLSSTERSCYSYSIGDRGETIYEDGYWFKLERRK